jgi:hypothetical protein
MAPQSHCAAALSEFHPLAEEDATHLGPRPKLGGYDGYLLMVVYGAAAAGALLEIQLFCSPSLPPSFCQQPPVVLVVRIGLPILVMVAPALRFRPTRLPSQAAYSTQPPAAMPATVEPWSFRMW